MNLNKIKSHLIKIGFSSIDKCNFYKKNTFFINCINFQRKTSNDAFFINLGVHPIFHDDTLPNKEIDCYIRHRIGGIDGIDINFLNDDCGNDMVIKVIEQEAIPYFNYCDSLDRFFGDISIDDIASGNVVEQLKGVTKVRLALCCTKYYIMHYQPDRIYDFAKYGLSISGMATGMKREFKEIIKRFESQS
ncbi:DUF4304 domain-containing protein [Salmonella enterica subsp. enterica]